jgi:hypothetical protein
MKLQNQMLYNSIIKVKTDKMMAFYNLNKFKGQIFIALIYSCENTFLKSDFISTTTHPLE